MGKEKQANVADLKAEFLFCSSGDEGAAGALLRPYLLGLIDWFVLHFFQQAIVNFIEPRK